ncbi:nopaline-binding periplasmic protein [Alsobacter metallidurans]|uniref:Nopaline-binding periplasmic protein n=1 Tax=Alsobacter metallidurans TaxID=340221 RepID=A0A917I6I3_9HYPH|nr:transporter substrate-binding domain-containing protein [Alsobacter metallidurans]GGH16578.1 nopaline-binding periplasmic protein [Alsobacter metallidurans]
MQLKIIAAMALVGAAIVAGPAAAQQQKVRFATEGAFRPWNWTEADGSLAGFEIDLYKDLCKRAELDCTIQSQAFEGAIPALNAGKYDAIISGMSATPKREEVVLFTIPYGSTGQSFGVSKVGTLKELPDTGQLFPLSTPANEAAAQAEIDKLKPVLKGKVMGVQTASIAASFVDKYLKGVVEVREYKTTEQHDLDLAAGRVDLIMASMAYLTTAASKQGNEDMAITGPRFQGGVLGRGSSIGLRKGDEVLKAKLDKAIMAANADGTIEKLSQKYFGYDVSVK